MKAAARAVAILGAVAVGWLLFGAGPKDVTLVYDVSAVPQARAVEVEVVRANGDVLRRAELRIPAGESRVEHKLKLPEGDYVLRGRVDAPAGPRPFRKPLEVREAGTIVLALGG